MDGQSALFAPTEPKPPRLSYPQAAGFFILFFLVYSAETQ